MVVQNPVCQWNHLFIEPFIIPLGSPDQEYSFSTGVKGVEGSERLPVALGPEFLHIAVPGLLHSVGMWPTKSGSQNLQQLDADGERFLLVFGEGFPPFPEFFCKFNFPHGISIAWRLYLSSGFEVWLQNTV